MLLNAGILIGYLKTYRIATIEGGYGTFKTALAFKLAHELLESGAVKYCVTNMPCVFRDKPRDVQFDENGQLNVVIILDEGGIFLEDTRTAKKYLNFLRKMNVILIIPSAESPASRVRNLVVQRTFNAGVFGIPLLFYAVSLNQGKIKENISFQWVFPGEIFGIYDTGAAPISDGGIAHWLAKWTDEYRKRWGDTGDDEYSADLGSLAASDGNSLPEVEELRGVIADFQTEARILADTVSVLEQQSGKRRGKR